MNDLIPRHMLLHARESLDAVPAVVIQGARQVGKSTFAEVLVNDRDARMVTLDDVDVLAAAISDPVSFVEQHPEGTLVIDEVQRAPELMLSIKASIDRNRRPGRFVLTGSSNLLRLPRSSDSLAGRAITIELHPLSQGEIRGRRDDLVAGLRTRSEVGGFESAMTRSDYIDAIGLGGYPELLTLPTTVRSRWLDSYVQRLLERDLADLAPRVDAGRVGKLLRLLAANQSGELVKARIARDAAVPETSITTYVDLLQTLYLIDSLPAWSPNLTSREASKPKVTVVDSALALRLARVTTDQLEPVTSPHLGAAIEGFVVGELVRQRGWSSQEFEVFHYRDRTGLEVDVVVECFDGDVIGFEVKSGATAKSEHFTGLRGLRERLGDRFIAGYVLNTAARSHSFGDRLWSLPISSLWEL